MQSIPTRNYNQTVKYLLQYEKDNIGHMDQNGDSALHFAARKDNIEIISMLLEAGADVLLKNKHGHNAFAIAKTVLVKNSIQVVSIC
eukprot:Pgem_evm2s8700